MISRRLPRFLAVLLVLSMAACASGDKPSPAPSGAIGYKVGKPYQVNGVWYYPKVDYDYDKVGIASWYGDAFHGRPTANGETFDMNRVSAAHPTLPLPTLVQVTNLDNGRSMKVRINDRGPFVNNRIIDLSKRTADELGFLARGTARVRVTVLRDESRALAAALLTEELDDAERATAAPVTRVAQSDLGSATPRAQSARRPAPTAAAQPVASTTTVAPRTNVARSSQRIFVQAGSFSRYDNARRLASRLAPLGRTEVTPARIDGQDYFRVFVGPLSTAEEADTLLVQVLAAGQPDARVVVN